MESFEGNTSWDLFVNRSHAVLPCSTADRIPQRAVAVFGLRRDRQDSVSVRTLRKIHKFRSFFIFLYELTVMSGWSPPEISREWLVGVGVVYIALLGYSLVVVQQVLLLGLFPGLLLVSLYLLWRFLVAVEAIADALQRIAHQREQE